MAKKSMIAREALRVKLSKKRAARRLELKKSIADPDIPYSEKEQFIALLSKEPRDSSACRVNRRCASCGRSRAVYRRFGLCRMCLRNFAMRGYLPGLLKASW